MPTVADACVAGNLAILAKHALGPALHKKFEKVCAWLDNVASQKGFKDVLGKVTYCKEDEKGKDKEGKDKAKEAKKGKEPKKEAKMEVKGKV